MSGRYWSQQASAGQGAVKNIVLVIMLKFPFANFAVLLYTTTTTTFPLQLQLPHQKLYEAP